MSRLACEACREAGLPDEHEGPICRLHGIPLTPVPDEGTDHAVAADPDEPAAGTPPEGPAARCWRCRAALADPDGSRCRSCDAALPGPTLALHFDTGVIAVDRNERTELGRSSATPHSRILSADTVSRRHAVVWVDGDDRAWIEPGDALNGTWLAGERLAPGSAVRLSDGDVVGLGRTVRARVVVQRWPA